MYIGSLNRSSVNVVAVSQTESCVENRFCFLSKHIRSHSVSSRLYRLKTTIHKICLRIFRLVSCSWNRLTAGKTITNFGSSPSVNLFQAFLSTFLLLIMFLFLLWNGVCVYNAWLLTLLCMIFLIIRLSRENARSAHGRIFIQGVRSSPTRLCSRDLYTVNRLRLNSIDII